MEHDQQVDADSAEFVPLKTVVLEIGISRITLKKYLSQLGIQPRSFHIRDRSLYISREEFERVKQLRQNPTLLERLRVRSS